MVISVCKKYLLLDVVFLLFAVLAHAETIGVGSQAPQFMLKDAAGKNVYTLEQYRGKKIVYLDFFATWCTNCREEMDQLKEIYGRYKKEGLELIAINVQEGAPKVNKFVSKYEIPFPVLLDENAAIAKRYNIVGFPSNLIIDGDGKIRYMDSLPPKDFEKLFSELKETLKLKTAPAPLPKK